MSTKTITTILKICCVFIFIGRGYQHLFWDAPFRSLLWDQKLLEPVITNVFNMTWNDYVTSLKIDSYIQQSIKLIGILYCICAVLVVLVHQHSKQWMKNIIYIGGVNLVCLSLLLTKDKFYHLAMFFEHSIQFGLPFLLLYFLKNRNRFRLQLLLKVTIAVAFVCHGLYAIGTLYPIPANFVTMTLNILPVNEPTAKQLLVVMGVIDFVIAIGIFIPKITKPFLIYAVFWGIATALARLISPLVYGFSVDILHQYLYLVVYRIPHGLAPLLILLMSLKPKRTLRFAKEEEILYV
ncbi:MAG: hypothetical protein ACPGU9_03870 [Flavobacteriaceae bacterium]